MALFWDATNTFSAQCAFVLALATAIIKQIMDKSRKIDDLLHTCSLQDVFAGFCSSLCTLCWLLFELLWALDVFRLDSEPLTVPLPLSLLDLLLILAETEPLFWTWLPWWDLSRPKLWPSMLPGSEYMWPRPVSRLSELAVALRPAVADEWLWPRPTPSTLCEWLFHLPSWNLWKNSLLKLNMKQFSRFLTFRKMVALFQNRHGFVARSLLRQDTLYKIVLANFVWIFLFFVTAWISQALEIRTGFYQKFWP